MGREVEMRKKKPVEPDMTVDEWLDLQYRSIAAKPFKEQAVYLFPHYRAAAQKLEWWKTCCLPGCRRARQCCGVVDPDKVIHTWQLAMPACCQGKDDRKYALMDVFKVENDAACAELRKDIDNGRYTVVDGNLVDHKTQRVDRQDW